MRPPSATLQQPFSATQRIVDSWGVLDVADYRTTWTYLRKAMLADWCDRSNIDAMFRIQPPTNDLDNVDSLTADVMEAFGVVTETLTQRDPQTVVA